MKTIKTLTTDEFTQVLDIFKTILESEEKTKEVKEWLDYASKRYSPMFMFRAESIVTINDSIFTNEDIRTFILSVSFKFFSLCSIGDNFLDRLYNSLENGLLIDDGETSTIPEQVRHSLINKAFQNYTITKKYLWFSVTRKVTFKEFLKSNKHFIIILLNCLIN